MKNNKGILQALLPGARIDKNTNKIFVHTGTSNDVIKINVGGSIFETYKSTLSAVPSSRLSDESFLSKFYRADQNDYFFDRDPEIFHCVLNYFRSGELHLPTSVCGLVVKSELEFWGIRDDNIEECCWSRYSGWTSTLHALRKLEDDQTSLMTYWEYPPEDSPPWLKKIRRKIWSFCSQPSSSRAARAYAATSLTVIFVSVFSFCAGTHRLFKVPSGDVSIMKSAWQNETANISSPTALTYDDVKTIPHPALVYIDIACLVFFCLELITRVLTSPHPFRFLVMPMTVIELLAVLTDLIDHVIRMTYLSTGSDETLVSVVSFMKLLRVFRVFRLMRHIPGLWILIYTLKASIKDLFLLLLFVVVGMLIFSSLIYFAEHDTQETFSSIPKCFWWSVVTMTTVGYGDMHPVTVSGYFIGAATGISGVLLIGFTVPVLVNNFVMYYNYARTLRREKVSGRSKISEKGRKSNEVLNAADEIDVRDTQDGNDNLEGRDSLLRSYVSTDVDDRRERSYR